jgi:hypothetical protein
VIDSWQEQQVINDECSELRHLSWFSFTKVLQVLMRRSQASCTYVTYTIITEHTIIDDVWIHGLEYTHAIMAANDWYAAIVTEEWRVISAMVYFTAKFVTAKFRISETKSFSGVKIGVSPPVSSSGTIGGIWNLWQLEFNGWNWWAHNGDMTAEPSQWNQVNGTVTTDSRHQEPRYQGIKWQRNQGNGYHLNHC